MQMLQQYNKPYILFSQYINHIHHTYLYTFTHALAIYYKQFCIFHRFLVWFKCMTKTTKKQFVIITKAKYFLAWFLQGINVNEGGEHWRTQQMTTVSNSLWWRPRWWWWWAGGDVCDVLLLHLNNVWGECVYW